MSITNFRDIGGYKTADGRAVRRGIFYRSAPIRFKDEEERREFEACKIKTILDLRSETEREIRPDEEVAGCNYLPCSAIPESTVNGGNLDMVALIKSGDFAKLGEYVRAVYKSLPFANEAYRVLFDLMRKDELPVVFHCSAGKDRTGFAAYLILKTLGVPDETVMEDYLLSNVCRKAENDAILAKFPQASAAEGLLNVKAEYLQSAIDEIFAKYANFEAYLAAEYGVTADEIAAFRDRYTEE